MATPLDEERARLREAGYTDEEISRYFVERLRGEGQTPGAGGGAAPQANMSGVLGNANAVLGHVRATIPVVTSATANLSNPAAPPKQRITSAAILVGVAVIVSVLGFAVWQEWQQHIVYETEIKRLNTEITRINVELTTAQNEKAKAEAEVAKQVAAGQVAQAEKAKEDAKVAPEVAAGQAAEARKKEAEAKYAEELAEGQKAQACTARMDMITKTIPPAEWGDAMEAFNRDCNPVEAKRLKECEEKFKTFITALETLDTSDPHPADTLLAKAKEYKSECPFGEEEKAATQAALDRRQAKIDKITEVLSKLQHRTPEPTPTAEATPTTDSTAMASVEPSPTVTNTPLPAATPSPTPTPTTSALATPEPSPTPAPLRTPENFDCKNGKHMGTDWVICASPELLDAEARLEDVYKAAHAAKGDAIQKEQWDWIKRYGPDCGLPLRGRPRDDQINSAAGCVRSAIEKRIKQLDGSWLHV